MDGNEVIVKKRGRKKGSVNRPPAKQSVLVSNLSHATQKILRKNLEKSLERPRMLKVIDPSKITGQYLMIEAIAMAYGGYVKFANWISMHLGRTSKAQRQCMVNWRLRGGVPIRLVYIYSELLSISPYVLNYKAVCEQLPNKEHPSWKSVVAACQFIPEEHRSKIANRVPYVGYKEGR